MISCTLIFGPLHGRQFTVDGQLNDRMLIPEVQDIAFRFERYEHGEPFRPPSMRMKTHTYVLHEVYEQGVEECAIFFHAEDCCDKTYPTTVRDREEYQPRIQPGRHKKYDIY